MTSATYTQRLNDASASPWPHPHNHMHRFATPFHTPKDYETAHWMGFKHL